MSDKWFDYTNAMQNSYEKAPWRETLQMNSIWFFCSSSVAFRRNMRVHTAEKPYNCTQCDYSCSYSVDLKKHVRVHTGEKSHKCTQFDYYGVTGRNHTSALNMTILPLKQRIWRHKKSTQLRFVLNVIIPMLDQNSLSFIYRLNRSFVVLLCILSFISRNALQDNYNILILHTFLSVRHYGMIPQAGLWD